MFGLFKSKKDPIDTRAALLPECEFVRFLRDGINKEIPYYQSSSEKPVSVIFSQSEEILKDKVFFCELLFLPEREEDKSMLAVWIKNFTDNPRYYDNDADSMLLKFIDLNKDAVKCLLDFIVDESEPGSTECTAELSFGVTPFGEDLKEPNCLVCAWVYR